MIVGWVVGKLVVCEKVLDGPTLPGYALVHMVA